MADNKIIVDVEIKDKGTKELKSIKNNFKEYTKEIDKNRDAQAGLDQLTGGAISKFKSLKGQVLANFKAIGLLTKGLGKFKLALLSTGIGALVVAVGVIAANWEKITDFINGTNRELLDLEENTKKLIQTTNDEITLLEKQKQLIELQGGNVDEVNNKLLQKFELQKKSLEILLRELELELEVTKEQEKQLSTWEIMKLQFTSVFKSQEFAAEYAKATSEETEKTKEIQDKIQETKSKILDLDIKTLKITTDKAKKEKEATDELKKQEELKAKAVRDALLKEIDETVKANEKIGALRRQFFLQNLEDIEANQIAKLNLEREAKIKEIEDSKASEIAKRMALAELNKFYDNEEQRVKDENIEKRKEEEKKELERIQALEEKKRQTREKTFDNAVKLAGEETKMGKALLLAKQVLLARQLILDAKEQISTAKKAVANATVNAAQSGTELAKGASKAASAAPPPFNIPFILTFAATAAGIVSAMKSALSATKTAAASAGASGGGGSNIQAPRISTSNPAFNIVGAGGTNQLAEAIAGQQQQPIRAFVVEQDVSSATQLQRQLKNRASL